MPDFVRSYGLKVLIVLKNLLRSLGAHSNN